MALNQLLDEQVQTKSVHGGTDHHAGSRATGKRIRTIGFPAATLFVSAESSNQRNQPRLESAKATARR